MDTIQLSVTKGEWLADALKLNGYNGIPTNCILHKTITGLGATHSELKAERNSIIIEPNVPVILGKTKDHPEWLAVYKDCKDATIKAYLLNKDIRHKKLLTTPESFHKIRAVAQAQGINIYKDFFCLFDECEKLTQDVGYRGRITQPIYDFFHFTSKAFVSATPLAMSHPKFKQQGFQLIKIVPDYDYRKDIELIITNSYFKTLRKTLDRLKDSKHICIFFNVTDGINDIIDKLGIENYKIFCSDKSVKKLNERGIYKAYTNIEGRLAKINFFTCRFYSGLDIVLRKNKADIIILTDFRTAYWTMVDPFTEAIQIQGRFRKTTKDEEKTYNSLTHIATVNPKMEVIGRGELKDYLAQYEKDYHYHKEQLAHEQNPNKIKAIQKGIQATQYAQLLDEHGEVNPFSIDNLYNEERVKRYYLSATALRKAYEATGFFNVTLNDITECVGEDDVARLNSEKREVERNKLIVQFLEKITQDYDSQIITTEEKDGYIKLLCERPHDYATVQAYQKIGKAGIEAANYKDKKITKSLEAYKMEEGERFRLTAEGRKLVFAEFEADMGKRIPKTEVVNRLKDLFAELDLKPKVTQETIRDYFFVKEHNSTKPSTFTLEAPK